MQVFQVIFSMAHRERWSITKYILGKRALRDSVLGIDTSRRATPADLDRGSVGNLSARELPVEWSIHAPGQGPADGELFGFWSFFALQRSNWTFLVVCYNAPEFGIFDTTS